MINNIKTEKQDLASLLMENVVVAEMMSLSQQKDYFHKIKFEIDIATSKKEPVGFG